MTVAVTPALLRALREDINSALKSIAQKHGVALAVGSGTYDADGTSGHLKLNVAAIGVGDDGANPADIKARADWPRYAMMLGLPEDGVGRTIQYGGRPAKIIGLMPRRTRFPVLVEREDGKRELLPAEPVAVLLNREGK